MLLWKVQNSQQNLLQHSTKINGRVIKKKIPQCLDGMSVDHIVSKTTPSKIYIFLKELLLIQIFIFLKISQKQALSAMDGIKNWCKCIK